MTDWTQIQEHYDQGLEHTRLGDEFNFERLRTLDVLSRFLPKAPAVVYDIGGATGVYAFPLAERGYRVHLIEPIASQRQIAKERNRSAVEKIHSIEEGNALSLQKPDASADAVLLLGPLYHLVTEAQRVQAIREARRVLKPGGWIISAAISRYASFMAMMEDPAFADPHVQDMVMNDLKTGQHRNPPGMDLFTTAFFHMPEELRNEHARAGFRDVKVIGVEGPIWKIDDALLRDPEGFAARMRFLRMIEEDPKLLCASAHFLACARKIS